VLEYKGDWQLPAGDERLWRPSELSGQDATERNSKKPTAPTYVKGQEKKQVSCGDGKNLAIPVFRVVLGEHAGRGKRQGGRSDEQRG